MSNTRSPRARRKRASSAASVLVLIVIAVVLASRQKDHETPRTSDPSPPSATTGSSRTGAEPGVERAGPPKVPDAVTDSMLRIGTWNIEWLGKPEQRSGPAKGVPQTPDDIADYIVASGVSVLALQEIVAQAGRPPRSRELDAALATVQRRTGQSWKYVLFPSRSGDDGDDQLTGVAWDPAKVTPLNARGRPLADGDEPWPVPVKSGRSAQGSALWHRRPHAVKFSTGDGRTDFAIIVIHMKADYEGDFAAHRNEEAARLAELLPTVAETLSDRDVVILGDTNMTKPAEAARGTFERAGLSDLNAKAETTHWRGGATDRIFVPVTQPEFSDRRFEVMSDRYLDPKRWDPRDFKRRLSDHYMAVTTVRLMADDD